VLQGCLFTGQQDSGWPKNLFSDMRQLYSRLPKSDAWKVAAKGITDIIWGKFHFLKVGMGCRHPF